MNVSRMDMSELRRLVPQYTISIPATSVATCMAGGHVDVLGCDEMVYLPLELRYSLLLYFS